jgi:hypothetical protein
MHAASCTIKKRLLARLLFLLASETLFKEGSIALEALSETTNGDAGSVVVSRLPVASSSLRLSLPRILPRKRAVWRAVPRADRSSSRRALQAVNNGVVGIHDPVTRSVFGDGIRRRLPLRVALAKSTSAPLRF